MVQDLSRLAENSVTATSQSAGNMTSSNRQAMTAPGSQPVTPLPYLRDQDDPDLSVSAPIPVSWTGKPAPRAAGSWNPPAPAWSATEHPDVTRTAPPQPPEPTGEASAASIGVAGPARGATTGRSSPAVRAVIGNP